VGFTPEGKTLVSIGGNSLLTTDAGTRKAIKTPLKHEGNIQGGLVSPDGKQIASWFFFINKVLKVWDATTGKPVASLTLDKDATGGLAFSPDGKLLALGTGKGDYVRGKNVWSEGGVQLVEIATGKKVATLTGHKGKVLCAAFSPDGKLLATGSGDKTVKLWDVAAGKELATLTAHTGQVKGVAFSPDGRTLVTGGADLTVRVWEMAERK
jgi:WD40 repeat protein